MNSAQVIQTIRTQRKEAAKKMAASPLPLIPAEIRLALVKEAIKLKTAKLANCPADMRQVILLQFVADGLANRKTASRDHKMLLAELEGCRKIGEFMRKEAFLGKMLGKGIGMLGRGAMTRPGMMLGGMAIGGGIAGRSQLEQAGSTIGGRMTNAYNSLFNPAAVQSQQQMAGTFGQGPGQGVRQSPAQNPFDMDFNSMSMGDFMKHRQMLQARMQSMDQAYPGFMPQQPPQQPFVVQQPQGKPLVYNPNGNTPRYYGI